MTVSTQTELRGIINIDYGEPVGLEIGLHDMRKISNCDYFDWHCDCDMIHDIEGNDHVCIIILIFID